MKLSLGTAQLGLSYGVSNDSGQPSTETAFAVLDRALQAGVELIDTAPAYGSSEELIGRWLPAGAPIGVMTKAWGQGDAEATVERFHRSLSNLRVERTHALLVHDVGELRGSGAGRLGAALEGLKAEGLTEKLGVSIYEAGDLEPARQVMPVDVVELPLNAFDQRLLHDGTIARLQTEGIEVHVRSVFLQGLLLMSRSSLPPHLEHAAASLDRFHVERERYGLTAVQAALGFVAGVGGLRSAVVGVNRPEELDECLTAAAADAPLDYSDLNVDDESIIDPRRWSQAQ